MTLENEIKRKDVNEEEKETKLLQYTAIAIPSISKKPDFGQTSKYG